jgi:hypothetical protein
LPTVSETSSLAQHAANQLQMKGFCFSKQHLCHGDTLISTEKGCGLCSRNEAGSDRIADCKVESCFGTGMEGSEPPRRVRQGKNDEGLDLDGTGRAREQTSLQTCVAYFYFARQFAAHLTWIRAKLRKKFLLISAKTKKKERVGCFRQNSCEIPTSELS